MIPVENIVHVASELGTVRNIVKVAEGESLSPVTYYNMQQKLQNNDWDDVKENTSAAAETASGILESVGEFFGKFF